MQAIFQEAFKFAFKDRNWILKILIGGVLNLIPVFTIGYFLSILRDSVDNKPPKMPEWNNWVTYAQEGFWGLVIFLFYSIPLLVLNVLSGSSAAGKVFFLLSFLVNLITIPLFFLALIRWIKLGAWKDAFAYKEVWQGFEKDRKNYVIATLVLSLPLFFVTLILNYLGYFPFRSAVLFFPGIFVQLFLLCLTFWISVVGARVFGQLYSGVQKQ